MSAHFFDSSALVKRYRDEQGTPRIVQLLREPVPLIICSLAEAEVAAAIIRRGRSLGVSAEEIAGRIQLLMREVRDSYEVIDVDDAIIKRAVELIRAHALRGADAVQLACAILAREQYVHVDMVSADQDLNAAASSEGFIINDPAIA